ncbi:hypothetical protein D3C85_1263890 [compost metagenome]
MIDPCLELAAAKALGGIHQFLQRRDHVVLQFIQAEQQDDHGGEQRRTLDHLLPALFMFALALQQADELVELVDEGQGAGLKAGGVATLQGGQQGLLPVVLQLLVTGLQLEVLAVFEHRFQCRAVEPLLQAVADALELDGFGPGGQLPAQVVGLHAHGTGGVDRRRIALAEPGDQPGAERTGQGQHGDQDHRQACARGQRTAQPADHGRQPGARRGKRHMEHSKVLQLIVSQPVPGALPLKSLQLPVLPPNQVEN